VANHSSAIRPTRNGERMAPNAVVPAARPISFPEKWSCWPSQVPSVTYQTPQTKYSKNIITDSRILICKSTRWPPVVIRCESNRKTGKRRNCSRPGKLGNSGAAPLQRVCDSSWARSTCDQS
jgi:hypothetical protein